MLIKTFGSAVYGVDAVTITIEVGIDKASTKYYMVGLPDNAVKESLQRIEMSLKHVGFKMPRYKIVINLAPADIKKEGSAYDLPIAIGILIASGQIEDKIDVSKYIIMGELSLDGSIQPIRGALPIAIQARKEVNSKTCVNRLVKKYKGKDGILFPSFLLMVFMALYSIVYIKGVTSIFFKERMASC